MQLDYVVYSTLPVPYAVKATAAWSGEVTIWAGAENLVGLNSIPDPATHQSKVVWSKVIAGGPDVFNLVARQDKSEFIVQYTANPTTNAFNKITEIRSALNGNVLRSASRPNTVAQSSLAMDTATGRIYLAELGASPMKNSGLACLKDNGSSMTLENQNLFLGSVAFCGFPVVPVYSSSKVYVPNFVGMLIAFNAATCLVDYPGENILTGNGGSIAVDATRVYRVNTGASQTIIAAYDKNNIGAGPVWVYDVGFKAGVPAVANNFVYSVNAATGKPFALAAASGALQWSAFESYYVPSSIAAVGEKVLVVTGTDGYLKIYTYRDYPNTWLDLTPDDCVMHLDWIVAGNPSAVEKFIVLRDPAPGGSAPMDQLGKNILAILPSADRTLDDYSLEPGELYRYAVHPVDYDGIVCGASMQIAATQTIDWPMFQRNQFHDASDPGMSIALPLSVHWTDTFPLPPTPGSVAFSGYQNVVIRGGVAYMTSVEGIVRAYDIATGTILWQRSGFGGMASSALYFNGKLGITHSCGFVMLDTQAKGATVVSIPSSVIGIAQESSPIIYKGVVYVGTILNSAFRLVALDVDPRSPTYLQILWTQPQNTFVKASASAAQDKVYFVDGSGYLRAYNARTGAIIWSRYLGPWVTTTESICMTVAPPVVLVAHENDRVYAYKADDGTPLWNTPVDAQFTSAAITTADIGGVSKTVAVISSHSQGVVRAIDLANGSILHTWTIFTPMPGLRLGAPIVGGANVVVYDTSGKVYLLDFVSTTPVGSLDLAIPLSTSHLAAGANHIFVTSPATGLLVAVDPGPGSLLTEEKGTGLLTIIESLSITPATVNLDANRPVAEISLRRNALVEVVLTEGQKGNVLWRSGLLPEGSLGASRGINRIQLPDRDATGQRLVPGRYYVGVMARAGGITDKRRAFLTVNPTNEDTARSHIGPGASGGRGPGWTSQPSASSADNVSGRRDNGVRDHGQGEGRDGSGNGKAQGNGPGK